MNIYKFPFTLDPEPILREIETNDRLWNATRFRSMNVYEQRHTSSIALREPRNRRGVRTRDSEDIYETIYYSFFPEVRYFSDWFTSTYGGECGRIAIVKLPSGKLVSPHIDVGEYYRKRDRFHFVLKGTYRYTVENDIEIMTAGDLFWFDSQKYHSAETLGSNDRIAIIFDVLGSEFRKSVGT